MDEFTINKKTAADICVLEFEGMMCLHHPMSKFVLQLPKWMSWKLTLMMKRGSGAVNWKYHS